MYTVTEIRSSVFRNKTFLTNVALPDSLEILILASSAFFECTNLHRRFSFPVGLTAIGSGAFQNCTALSEIDLPESLVRIDASAMSGCENLSRVKLPKSLTTMGTDIFRDCAALTSVVVIPSGAEIATVPAGSIAIRNDVTAIPANAFGNAASLVNITPSVMPLRLKASHCLTDSKASGREPCKTA